MIPLAGTVVLLLGYGVRTFTALPDRVAVTAVVGVGVVLPRLVTAYPASAD